MISFALFLFYFFWNVSLHKDSTVSFFRALNAKVCVFLSSLEWNKTEISQYRSVLEKDNSTQFLRSKKERRNDNIFIGFFLAEQY